MSKVSAIKEFCIKEMSTSLHYMEHSKNCRLDLKVTNVAIFLLGMGIICAMPTILPLQLLTYGTISILGGSAANLLATSAQIESTLLILAVAASALGACIAYRHCMHPKVYGLKLAWN